MQTEAQKRARDKWNKENRKQIVINFYPRDRALYDFAKSKESAAEYIRDLIMKDMENNSK